MGEKDLITLKEAAKITGYTSDYIGQLIRAGKIPGKQVYSNIAWMTTAKAVEDYKNRSKDEKRSVIKDSLVNQKRKIQMEINILKLFFKTFRSALPLVIIIIITFVFLLTYILSFGISQRTETFNSSEGTPKELTF